MKVLSRRDGFLVVGVPAGGSRSRGEEVVATMKEMANYVFYNIVDNSSPSVVATANH